MSVQTPTLRPYSRGPVPIQTAEEAAALDRRAIDDVGVSQPVLMENAGRSAAMVLGAIHGLPRRVVAVVGSGNNGGDGLVAARALEAWGCDVRILLVADRPVGDPLLHGWRLTVLQDSSLSDTDVDALFSWADVVVDGILGTGARGAPRERQARVIERLNASGRPVVSLDVPSGVDATSGRTAGAVVRAATTVSFG
ncbi:MAG: NAD(P)H-hydrate epimerase, partial [Gemmatimonadota bacterium]|nr:NAD(P)H-hydrate epimerase [Gemmatimonadota bacterium]